MIFRVSLSPGSDPKYVTRVVKQLLAERRNNDPDFRFEEIQIISSQVPFNIGAKNPLVSSQLRAATKAGLKSTFGGELVGAGDLYYFLERGILGVTFGAGSLVRCHVPNEFVSVDELVNQTKVYALSALALCRAR